MLRGMVRVSCGQRDQAGEDPEERHALDSNILDRVLVDALHSNAALGDYNFWGCCEEDKEEIECAEETRERHETHQGLDQSLELHEESHGKARIRRLEI